MASHLAERAIEDALTHGRALIKFISANDVGATGGHQYGFYLPKAPWRMLTPHAPVKGSNKKSSLDVLWPDGRITKSTVTWYGVGTRSEYRLTGFQKDFPYLDRDSVGSLLVIVPVSHANFIAHVLDTDDDIADVQAALGLEVIDRWGIYDKDGKSEAEDPQECIERRFRDFIAKLDGWPKTAVMSESAREVLYKCIRDFAKKPADTRLVEYMDREYRLFQMVERQLCGPEIGRPFASVDDFVRTASSIMNRRKSRAGWSLENHVAALLTEAKIPFSARAAEIEGEPDLVIPSMQAYKDAKFPTEKLCMVGVKTTCKDRWRQVLREGKRIETKHILTMQRGISAKQLIEMKEANVRLIVPKEVQKDYPKVSGVKLLQVDEFIEYAKKLL